MKIAYILYPEVIISNRSNGVRSQAEAWANLLRNDGHVVDFVNNWCDYDWKDYDTIHLFGGGRWILPIARRMSAINSNLVWSPICDPNNDSSLLEKVIEKLKKKTNGIFKWNYLYQIRKEPFVKMVLSRSQFETEYLHRVYSVPRDRISKVPLSYSNYCLPYVSEEKEPFCLHISSIYQPRKNVVRLIEAAKKYQFKLVLAGNKGSEQQFEPLKKAIGDCKNIEILGYISEEEKIKLYKRAKVFALPSITEGVGIVAVDAAYFGCEIVITNIPGPKEYYDGKCIEVYPMDVDAIGNAVVSLMSGKVSYQPQLAKDVERNYSGEIIVQNLVQVYGKLSAL